MKKRLKRDYGFDATVSAKYPGNLNNDNSTHYHSGKIARPPGKSLPR